MSGPLASSYYYASDFSERNQSGLVNLEIWSQGAAGTWAGGVCVAVAPPWAGGGLLPSHLLCRWSLPRSPFLGVCGGNVVLTEEGSAHANGFPGLWLEGAARNEALHPVSPPNPRVGCEVKRSRSLGTLQVASRRAAPRAGELVQASVRALRAFASPAEDLASLPGLRWRVPQPKPWLFEKSVITDVWAVPTCRGMFARSMGYDARDLFVG